MLTVAAAVSNVDRLAFIHQGPGLLLVGLVALFACSRLLVGTLPQRNNAIGLRALAYFIPIAAASVIAMLLGRPEIAVGIVFGTSVGALTTVIGFVAVAAPIDAAPARWRRIWPFQLAAALLVFVAGFGGTFGWREAIALATEGMLLLALWNDASDPASALTRTADVLDQALAPRDAAAASVLPYRAGHDDRATSSDMGRWALLALEIPLVAALLWLGGLTATRGAVTCAANYGVVSTSALAGSVISLSMVLPMTYGAWRLSAGGRGWATVTTQMGVVMLNLCALLPLLIMIPYLAAHVPSIASWAGGALSEGNHIPRLLLFPPPMWRIDNVLLIVAGALLLPVGMGKWSLGREEGMILIATYFFYLTTTAASGLDH